MALTLELLRSIYCGVWGWCAQHGTRDQCPCTVPEVVPVYFTNCWNWISASFWGDSFSAIRGGKNLNNVHFQQLLKNYGSIRPAQTWRNIIVFTGVAEFFSLKFSCVRLFLLNLMDRWYWIEVDWKSRLSWCSNPARGHKLEKCHQEEKSARYSPYKGNGNGTKKYPEKATPPKKQQTKNKRGHR